jgi:uncharacterized protein YfaT (DUF1175 family)
LLILLLAVSPEALRLDDSRDRDAFRRWFTFLAEAQFFNDPAARPPEITDCSALIRYAYREAFRNHDSRWAAEANLPLVLPYESIAKYNYPRTPAGPSIFRTADGYAQFADARTLRRHNTRFVSRDIRRAQPGDLLFYRNERSHHAMIFIGPSHIARDDAVYVVYHTGPEGRNPGEMRRPPLSELMSHPDAQWRPVESNPNFLGVYRWIIL